MTSSPTTDEEKPPIIGFVAGGLVVGSWLVLPGWLAMLVTLTGATGLYLLRRRNTRHLHGMIDSTNEQLDEIEQQWAVLRPQFSHTAADYRRSVETFDEHINAWLIRLDTQHDKDLNAARQHLADVRSELGSRTHAPVSEKQALHHRLTAQTINRGSSAQLQPAGQQHLRLWPFLTAMRRNHDRAAHLIRLRDADCTEAQCRQAINMALARASDVLSLPNAKQAKRYEQLDSLLQQLRSAPEHPGAEDLIASASMLPALESATASVRAASRQLSGGSAGGQKREQTKPLNTSNPTAELDHVLRAMGSPSATKENRPPSVSEPKERPPAVMRGGADVSLSDELSTLLRVYGVLAAGAAVGVATMATVLPNTEIGNAVGGLGLVFGILYAVNFLKKRDASVLRREVSSTLSELEDFDRSWSLHKEALQHSTARLEPAASAEDDAFMKAIITQISLHTRQLESDLAVAKKRTRRVRRAVSGYDHLPLGTLEMLTHELTTKPLVRHVPGWALDAPTATPPPPLRLWPLLSEMKRLMLAVAGLTEAVNTAGGEAVIRQRCSSALQAAKRALERQERKSRRAADLQFVTKRAAAALMTGHRCGLLEALELIPLIEKLTQTVTASTAHDKAFERNAARRRRRKQLAERAQAQAQLFEDELDRILNDTN